GILFGQSLEEEAPPRKQVRLVRRLTVLQAEQMGEARLDEPSVLAVGHVTLHSIVQLRQRGGPVLAFQDPGPTTDHLRQRPVRHALAVRQAPAPVPEEQALQPVHVLEELPAEPGLADPGNAGHLDQVSLPVLDRRVEEILYDLQLAIATDERRLESLGLHQAASAGD